MSDCWEVARGILLNRRGAPMIVRRHWCANRQRNSLRRPKQRQQNHRRQRQRLQRNRKRQRAPLHSPLTPPLLRITFDKTTAQRAKLFTRASLFVGHHTPPQDLSASCRRFAAPAPWGCSKTQEAGSRARRDVRVRASSTRWTPLARASSHGAACWLLSVKNQAVLFSYLLIAILGCFLGPALSPFGRC